MTNEKSKLRTLLLQTRSLPNVCREEHESFARHSELSTAQIEILNVFETPQFDPTVIDGYDALFVGGSSKASVLEPESYPFLKPSQDLLLYCLERHIPVFASCFGFQLAVIALGGEIIRKEQDFELGTVPIYLSEHAKNDPLFCDTPDGFFGVSVHKEMALELPPQCTILASTAMCRHAFRVGDAPFWGFQFHPEVDLQRLIERLAVYKDQYTESEADFQRYVATFSETPESNNLLRKFVNRILLD